MSLILLFIVGHRLIRSNKVQTFITQKILFFISGEENQIIKIGQVNIDFFDHISLNDVLILDEMKDSLLFAKKLTVNLSLIHFIQKKIHIDEIICEEWKTHIYKREPTNTFNFTFLLNPKKKRAKKHLWDLQIKRIVSENGSIYFDDQIAQTKATIILPYSIVNLEKINQKDTLLESIHIDNIQLKEPLISWHSRENKTTVKKKIKSTKTPHIYIQKINLESGSVYIRNASKPTQKATGKLDVNNLQIKQLNIESNQMYYANDILNIHIHKLSAKEKSGFTIKQMKTKLRSYRNQLELNTLRLTTNHSHIDLKSKINFNTQKETYIKIYKGDIALEDINYFTSKTIKDFPYKTLSVKGYLSAISNNINGQNILLKMGDNELISDFSIIEANDLKNRFVHLDIHHFMSDGQFIYQLLKPYTSIQHPHLLTSLGQISYQGNIQGKTNTIQTKGVITSQLGSLKNNIQISKVGEHTFFDGKLSLNNFDIGNWLKKSDLYGHTTAYVYVKGQGISLRDIQSEVKGQIKQIYFKQYNYHNIMVNGTFKKEQFKGDLTIKDPNIDLDFKGMVHLDSTYPTYISTLNIKKINPKALHLSTKNYSLSGRLTTDISGKNIDDISGHIQIDSLILTDNHLNKQYKFEYISVFSHIDNTKKSRVLTLESPIGLAVFQGDFSFRNIPKRIANYIAHYSKKSHAHTYSMTYDESVSFSIDLHSVNNLTEIIHPQLKYIAPSFIEGTFHSKENQLILNGKIPHIKIGNYQFKNIQIAANSNTDELNINSSLKELYANEKLLTEDIYWTSYLNKDRFKYILKIQEKNLNTHMYIHGGIQIENKCVIGNIDDAQIWVNKEKWIANTSNKIKMGPKILDIKNLDFISNRKNISIYTKKGENNTTDAFLAFQGIHLDFKTRFSKSGKEQRLFGRAKGLIEITDVFKKQIPTGQIDLNQCGINQDTIGVISLRSKIDKKNKKAILSGYIKGQKNQLSAKGFYLFKKNKQDLSLNLAIDKIDVSIIDNISNHITYNTQGFLTGNIAIKGKMKALQATGYLETKDVESTINQLHTRYFSNNQKIWFYKNAISLHNFKVTDHLKNNALASGNIEHKSFKNIFLDIKIHTDKITFLNASEEKSPHLYGKVFGKGTVWIHGFTHKNINIESEAETLAGTNIYIPLKSEKDTKKYNFYRFVNKANPQKKINSKASKQQAAVAKKQAIIDLRLKVTEAAKANLIFNKISGDQITTNGSGNIRININQKGDLSLQGVYQINKGQYDFSFQNIIKKRFDIEKGSKIFFQGPVADAQIDVNAIYQTRTNPNDLVTNFLTNNPSIADNQQFNTRVPVDLLLKLDGNILSPHITFDIKAKDFNSGNNSSLDNALHAVKNDANELNKQVFGLLVLNKFLPIYNRNGNNPNNVGATTGTLAVNTISDFLSSQLTKYFNDWFGEYIKGLDLNFKYRTYDILQGSSNTEEQETTNPSSTTKRNEIEIGLTQRFLNDRLAISVGGNFDFGNEVVNQQTHHTTHITGDIEIAYALTEDGRFKIKAFSKGQFDALQARNVNRTGVGISYQQEFDSAKDLAESFRLLKERRLAIRAKKKKEKKKRKAKQLPFSKN